MKQIDISTLTLNKILAINVIHRTSNQVYIRKGRVSFAFAIKLSGKTFYKYNNKDYLSDNENMIFLSKNIDYSFFCKEPGECIMIEFDGTLQNEEFGIMSFHLNKKNSQEILKLFKNIAYIWNNKKDNYYLKCKSIFYEISYLASLKNNYDYHPKSTEKIIEKSMDYILNHYDDPNISNEFLAKTSGISTVYFRKVFFKIYNTSPIKYLNAIRFEKAKELLIGDYNSISDVATSVGFSSVYTFSKAFKNEIGESPSDYIKHFRNNID